MSTANVVEILRVPNLVFGGVLDGMVVWEAAIILPFARSLPVRDGLAALRFAGARAWKIAPVCGATANITGIVIVALWPWDGITWAAAFSLAGVVSMTTAVAVTYGRYVALDKRVRGVAGAEAPEDVPAAFRHLATLHALRTAFYTLGFVCFVVAAVID